MPQGSKLRLPPDTQKQLNQTRQRFDPAQASVLDGPGDTLMRWMGQLMGAGDPTASMMGVAGPMMAAGKAAVPVGLRQYIDELIQLRKHATTPMQQQQINRNIIDASKNPTLWQPTPPKN